MKLRIELDQPPARGFYTSLDVVYGTVVLDVRRWGSILQLSVCLQGRIRLLVMSTDLGYQVPDISGNNSDSSDSHQLFKTSKVLFPVQGLSPKAAGYGLDRGRYVFRFGMDFPLLTSCFKLQQGLQHTESMLPPSFSFRTTSMHAEAVYILQAKVMRPGLFRRRLIAERELRFIPLDPPTILQSNGFHFQKSGQELPAEEFDIHNQACNSLATLPRYSPSLFFEGVIPYPCVFYPGQHLPLKLFVTVPRDLLENLCRIWLRALDIRLQRRTIVQVGGCSNFWASHVLVHKVQLKHLIMPLPGTETVEIDNVLWRSCEVPLVCPSFSSCSARQDYTLEVIGGFSSGNDPRIKCVKVSMNVSLHVAIEPPSYDQVDSPNLSLVSGD